MKKRVRIYKAQTGMQMPQQQAPQITGEQIAQAAAMLIADQGLDPDEAISVITSQLRIGRDKVAPIVLGLAENIDARKREREAAQKGDESTLAKIAEEDDINTQRAAELEKRKREEMYYSDYSKDRDMDEDFYQQNILEAKFGAQLPSKRTFLKQFVKKAQEGMQMPDQRADSTDTGERKAGLQMFVDSLQSSATRAKLLEEGEVLYNNFKRGGLTRGQERASEQASLLATSLGANPYLPPLEKLEIYKTRVFSHAPKAWSAEFGKRPEIPDESIYTNTISNPARKQNELSLEEVDKAVNQDAKKEAADAKTKINQATADVERVVRTAGTSTPRRTTGTGTSGSGRAPWEEELRRRQEEQQRRFGITEDATGYFESSPWAYRSLADIPFQYKPVSKTQKEKEKEEQRKKQTAEAKAKSNNLGAGDLEVGWRPYYMNPTNAAWAYQTLPNLGKVYTSKTKKKAAPTPTGKLNKYAEMMNAMNAPSWKYQEEGGMVDSANPGLYKFLYGGNDGKLTDSPYFEDGGLIKAKRGYWQNGQWVEGVHPEDAAELRRTNDYMTNMSWTRPKSYEEYQPKFGWERSGMSPEELAYEKEYQENYSYPRAGYPGLTVDQVNAGNYPTGWGDYTNVPGYGEGRNLLRYNNPYIGNQYIGGYGYNPYMGGYGMPQYQLKQRGLPIDMASGERYYGDFMGADLAKLTAKGVRRSGVPRRLEAEFYVDDWDPKGTAAAAAASQQGRKPLFGSRPDTAFESRSRALSWVGSKLRPFFSEGDKTDMSQNPDQWGINELVEDTKRRQNAEMVAQTQLPTKGVPQPNVPEAELQNTQSVRAPLAPATQAMPFRKPSLFQTKVEDAQIIPTDYGTPDYSKSYVDPETMLEPDYGQRAVEGVQPSSVFQSNPPAEFTQPERQPVTQESYMNEVADQNQMDAQNFMAQQMAMQNPDYFTQGVYANEIPFGADPYSVINLNTSPAQQTTPNTPAPVIKPYTPFVPTRRQEKNTNRNQQNAPVNRSNKNSRNQPNTSSLEAYDRSRYGNRPALTYQERINFENQVDDWDAYRKSGMDIRDYLRLQQSKKSSRKREYGGDIPKAQMYNSQIGVDPIEQDPRFVPMPELSFVPPPITDMDPLLTDSIPFEDEVETPVVDTRSEWDPSRMKTKEQAEKEGVEWFDPGPKIDYAKKRVKVKYKNKEKLSGADRRMRLDLANAAINKGLSWVERQQQDYQRPWENYGSVSAVDMGNYTSNLGKFRPDDMGFTGVVRDGGSIYAEGGETWMSEDDIRRFLEEGGELEFV